MSNIVKLNRPIEIALWRVQNILDEMLVSYRYQDAQSRMIWFQLDTIKHLLEKELDGSNICQE